MLTQFVLIIRSRGFTAYIPAKSRHIYIHTSIITNYMCTHTHTHTPHNIQKRSIHFLSHTHTHKHTHTHTHTRTHLYVDTLHITSKESVGYVCVREREKKRASIFFLSVWLSVCLSVGLSVCLSVDDDYCFYYCKK